MLPGWRLGATLWHCHQQIGSERPPVLAPQKPVCQHSACYSCYLLRSTYSQHRSTSPISMPTKSKKPAGSFWRLTEEGLLRGLGFSYVLIHVSPESSYRKNDAELNLGTTMPYGKLVISCLLNCVDVIFMFELSMSCKIYVFHIYSTWPCNAGVQEWWQNDVLRWWI